MFGPINILKLPWTHTVKKWIAKHLRRESFTLTTNLLVIVINSLYMTPLKTLLKTFLKMTLKTPLKTFLKMTLKVTLKASFKSIKTNEFIMALHHLFPHPHHLSNRNLIQNWAYQDQCLKPRVRGKN